MTPRYRLFEVFGLEIEYAIVDPTTLSVLPIADELLRHSDGAIDGELQVDGVSWSNELALHVIELKCTEPARSLEEVPALFAHAVRRMLDRASGAALLGVGMHPWMDPAELRLWPHDSAEIYAELDRVFGCRGHGWANLQSVHLNLPFSGDEEFGLLHAAIRLVLPILPALSASSPIFGGAIRRERDARLVVYRTNAARIPEVTGRVVPEPVFSEAEYRTRIFEPLYRAIEPEDPRGVLRHEWLNARGAIARFDRGSIEIRVMDAQEHPAQDLAICAAVVSVLERSIAERWISRARQRALDTDRLAVILTDVVRDAEGAVVRDAEYLAALGAGPEAMTAGELWRHLLEGTPTLAEGSPFKAPLELILGKGSLATRIVSALPREPSKEALREVVRELTRCLESGRAFGP